MAKRTVSGFEQTPKSYDGKIKRQTKKVEQLRKKHDVVLDPGESIPLPIPKSHSGNKGEIVKGVTEILDYVQSYIHSGWFVIFTNSWGGSQLIKELVDLYKKAEAKGILVLAASGNNGSGKIGYPAAIESVISVGLYSKTQTGK